MQKHECEYNYVAMMHSYLIKHVLQDQKYICIKLVAFFSHTWQLT